MYKWAFKFKSLFIKKNSMYQNKLIKTLHKEHQNLFNLYIKITEETNPKKRLNLLQKFYYDYHLHILKEDKQLYAHLLVKYRFVPQKHKFIKEKQDEMIKITEFIENFAKKHSTLEAIESENFQQDLKILGEALTKRVEFEENELYSFY